MLNRFPSFRVVVIASVLLGATRTTSASDPASTGSSEARAPAPTAAAVSTRWLENGLRLVTVESPIDPKGVSIRLIVEDGYLRVRRSKLALPHLVEHLAFRDLSGISIGRSWLQSVGGHYNAHTAPFVVWYELDMPSHAAERTLRILRAQWDGEPFTAEEIQRESGRVSHELCSATSTAPIHKLAEEFAPGSILDRSFEDQLDALSTVRVEDTWEHFLETHVGTRMTLVVVAPAKTLQGLGGTLLAFADLPAGTPAPLPRLGDLSWLQGLLDGTKSFTDNAFGLCFQVPGSLSPTERILLGDAASSHLEGELSFKLVQTYGLRPLFLRSSEAEIWLFTAYTDFGTQSRDRLQAAAEKDLRFLAEDDARGWWAGCVRSWARRSWMYVDSFSLADHIVELAQLLPHDQALPRVVPDPTVSADTIRGKYGSILDSASFFRSAQSRIDPRDKDAAEEYRKRTRLVRAAWALQDWYNAQSWSLFVVLGLVLVFVVTLVRILDRDISRLWHRIRSTRTRPPEAGGLSANQRHTQRVCALME